MSLICGLIEKVLNGIQYFDVLMGSFEVILRA